MKAAVLTAYGSPDNQKIMDIPVPEPGPGQVRVKVAYAGLRYGDLYALQGLFTQFQPPLPVVQGQEITGMVEKIGPGVKNVKIGDRVAAPVTTGGFAGYAIAPANDLLFVPERCGLDQYLVYFINLRVAYLAVYFFGKVQDGETVLLHAPAGGVGMMIMQILKKRFKDIKIIAVTSSEEKMNRAKELGADFVINYKISDYVEETLKLLGGRKVDVVFNGVGGSTMKKDSKVIRPLGRWIIHGFSNGVEPPVFSGYDAHTIIPWSILPVATYAPQEFEKANAFLHDWVSKEELINPVVYPLEQIAEAEKLFFSGATKGKIVFKP